MSENHKMHVLLASKIGQTNTWGHTNWSISSLSWGEYNSIICLMKNNRAHLEGGPSGVKTFAKLETSTK